MHPTAAIRAVLLTCLAAALLLSGCSSSTLREGIWRLTYRAQVTQNRLPFPLDARELELQTGVDDDGNEIIELQPLDRDLTPAYGDVIDKGESRVVRIRHRVSGWQFEMYGTIQSPEAVFGRYFLAKSLQFEDLTIDGGWNLRWIREAGE